MVIRMDVRLLIIKLEKKLRDKCEYVARIWEKDDFYIVATMTSDGFMAMHRPYIVNKEGEVLFIATDNDSLYREKYWDALLIYDDPPFKIDYE